MTQDPEFDQFERRVGRALQQLPLPSAPPQFAARLNARMNAHAMPELPRAAVDASHRYNFEWPLALKVAVSGAGFVLIAAALLMYPLALESARSAWHAPSVVLLRTAVDAARPMVPVALVYITAMCAVAAAAVSMLKHVALGGAQQS